MGGHSSRFCIIRVVARTVFCEYSTKIHKKITEVIPLDMEYTENYYSTLQASIFPGQTSLVGHMAIRFCSSFSFLILSNISFLI